MIVTTFTYKKWPDDINFTSPTNQDVRFEKVHKVKCANNVKEIDGKMC